MTTPIVAAGAPQPTALQDAVPQATQNLFEHVAAQAKSMPEGAGPTQLGQEMLQNLKGFFERSGSFAERASGLTQRTSKTAGGELVSVGPKGAGATDLSSTRNSSLPVDQSQMDKVIQSLGMMFDHSIETQLVVRGTTQVSGAANTLLRGQ
jgi:DNA-directed RNA polymerase specialized sigma54-like protein